MKKAAALVGAGAFLLGVAVGFVGARQYWYRWAMARLATEVTGRAVLDIHALSRWRVGEETEARTELEAALDRAVSSTYAALRATGDEPPAETVQMLRLAKLYRAAYPPPADSPTDLIAALESVDLPDPGYCSPALQKLLDDVLARQAAASPAATPQPHHAD